MLAVLAFMYGIIFYNIGGNGASAFVLPNLKYHFYFQNSDVV